MSADSMYALYARNAQACEEAKHPSCSCHCGGAQHGTKHSDSSVREAVVKRMRELGYPEQECAAFEDPLQQALL